MADEIIDFYKKAKEPEEPQKPIEEQKETTVPVIPKPDEPFDRFLLELAEKLQKEKVITEKQQETFVEQIKEPVSTDPNENDPFKKFIGSFANILKQDELVTREENIKEATINFINKLKEQPDEPFIIQDEPIVKTKKQKYLPPKIAKKVQKLPQPVKKEEPVVEEQADEPVKDEPTDENSYVKELKTADKTNKKIPEKIKSVSDIKSIVEKQVAEVLSRYPNLGFTGGGGGTNAVQYAKGGTMDGDLNVTGKFLSGGVDISTLFNTGGGGIVSGIPDRLISGSQSLILNTDGSISFPDGFITAPDGQILNIQSETASPSSFARISLSPYAFFAYDNEGNSISFDVVDNAIVLTSKDQYEWAFNQQGVLVGPNGYLTVNALSSLGRILSGGKDLLEIFALSGTGGGGGGTGREDVNTIVISNSANWNTAYNVATAYRQISGTFVNITTLNSVSSLLLPTSVYQNASGNWQGTFTTVQSNSSNWNQAYSTATNYQLVSSSFATNSLVNSISSLLTPLALTNTLTGQLVTNNAFTNYQTDVANATATLLPTSIYQQASGNWQQAYTNLVTNSAAYLSGVDLTFLQEPSANWNSTYTTVQSNSSNWQNAYNTATVYQTNSSSYATNDYVNTNFFPLSGGTISGPTRINNNLTVFGNLTATGTTTFANTIFSVTSSLSVVHVGSGPALYVGNNGDGDIASFYDIDQGIEILHVGGINSTSPNVGIKVSTPNKTLTVSGEISATQDITTSGKIYIQNDGNSDQWNQAYNTATAYQTVSSSFATNTTVNSVSSLLTPLTLTNTLTSQLLPTSFYQTTSGQFALSSHAASHYTGGSDQLRPQDIGAQSIFSIQNLIITTTSQVSLTAARAKIYDIVQYAGVQVNVELPATNTFEGDVVVFRWGTGSDSIRVLQPYSGAPLATVSVGEQKRFIRGTTAQSWTLVPVDTHVHAAGDITSGIFDIARIPNLNQQYLPLSGGTLTGNLSVINSIEVNQINANVYLSGGINLFNLLSSSGGGGGGDPAVNTIVQTTSATWNNTTTVVQSNSASWFEPVRRFDYVTVANVDISYSGTAPFETVDTNPIWKLIRLTYANNGTISNSASALNSWTGRLTASYV